MSEIESYSPPLDPSTLMMKADADVSIAALKAADAQFLTNVTLAQAALLAVQTAGFRQFTVATNCKAGDRMFMSPAAPLPAGYALGDITSVKDGEAVCNLFTPSLAIGASYSIVARVIAFRQVAP